MDALCLYQWVQACTSLISMFPKNYGKTEQPSFDRYGIPRIITRLAHKSYTYMNRMLDCTRSYLYYAKMHVACSLVHDYSTL